MLTCIIVEDEPLALERTKGYVEKTGFLSLVETFNNGMDAMIYLKEHSVDLIFLDINMGEFSGIQLLESAKIESQVIITTAYDEYALKGYELNVTDYLLKPFSFERFLQAVNKIEKKSEETDYIFVKTEYRLEKIMLSDIHYIEGMRDYRAIHTNDKRIMTLQTFTELEGMVDKNIMRVHRSYMVAVDKIVSVERNRIYIKEEIIPISESYKKDFFEKIGG